jgi:hypothetical protein
MNEILSEIKSVFGVSGVLVLDKKNSFTYQLLPSSFDQEKIKNLSSNLVKLIKRMEGTGRIDFTYDNGKAFLYNLPHSAVLIYGRLSLNLSLLELVLKPAILSIEGKIKGEIKRSKEFSQKDLSSVLDQTYWDILIQTINRVSDEYKKIIGAHSVTQNLRKAKESLLSEFPLLSALYVDNTGEISIIEGQKLPMKREVVRVFARWISQFEKFCSVISDKLEKLNLRELTQDTKEELEGIGFYQIYESKQKPK